MAEKNNMDEAGSIPENELWLHTPEMRANLDRALEWSATHPRAETDLRAVEEEVRCQGR